MLIRACIQSPLLLPSVSSTSHPVDTHKLEANLLRDLGRLERSSLGELLAANLLLLEVHSLRLAEEEEEVSVWLRTAGSRQRQLLSAGRRAVVLLILRSWRVVLSQGAFRLSDIATVAAQRLQPRHDPVSPEGELGIIWRRRVWIDQHQGVRSSWRSVFLRLAMKVSSSSPPEMTPPSWFSRASRRCCPL